MVSLKKYLGILWEIILMLSIVHNDVILNYGASWKNNHVSLLVSDPLKYLKLIGQSSTLKIVKDGFSCFLVQPSQKLEKFH